MKKNQQLQTLESLLKKGNLIANYKESNFVDFNSLLSKLSKKAIERYISIFEQGGIRAFFVSVEELCSEKSIENIAQLSTQGLQDREYSKKFISIFEQGLLNNDSDRIEKIVSILRALLELEQNLLGIIDIEERPLFVAMYWLVAFPLDAINACNYEVKRCIRDTYGEILKNNINSISQRKISLNSKRLAILNYQKQIQNNSPEFYPFRLTFKIDHNNYSGRKCDDIHPQYRIK